jgi:K+-transporting ATPase KdpF subunit
VHPDAISGREDVDGASSARDRARRSAVGAERAARRTSASLDAPTADNDGGGPVSVGETIAVVIAIMLLVYLVYALLRPERF